MPERVFSINSSIRIITAAAMFALSLLHSTTVSAKKFTTEPQHRTVIAFYDSKFDRQPFDTTVHQLAEMPLNHLGLKVRYHDINTPLPTENTLVDVRGILLWLPSNQVHNPDELLRWLLKQSDSGRQVVVMGWLGFEQNLNGGVANSELLTEFWRSLGLKKSSAWTTVTYNKTLKSETKNMVAYEKDFIDTSPAFPNLENISKKTHSIYSAYSSSGKKISEIITVGERGSYIAPGYTHQVTENGKKRYWFINPFDFFKRAFGLGLSPIPDTTTLVGRRLYYSHIDGDGWRNETLVPKYKGNFIQSAEVILNEILLNYPDMPVTVAPVVADLDTQWFGSNRSLEIAQEIFELPHVEAGSHTYSHPLHWNFFEDYEASSESVFLEAYKESTGNRQKAGVIDRIIGSGIIGGSSVLDSPLLERVSGKHESMVKEVFKTYATPRAFYNGPYDLTHDISGSIEFIQNLLPKGKRVALLQWSGNTLPFSDAIRESRNAGVRNLNGGDTRFDREFDSVSWVMPIGRYVEGERQIYASASNENTYTNLWTNRFHGLAYLTETLARTESPVRLKPMNIYYHMYSGERLASLNALHNNLRYAQSKRITPVRASIFAGIAEGFYSTKIEKISESQWRVSKRGLLQTLRFDQATLKSVDFSKSKGVMGQTHLQGSLYVALDPVSATSIIALKDVSDTSRDPSAKRPYLIDSRWQVNDVKIYKNSFQFVASGFGAGEMTWYVPRPGNYHILIKSKGQRSQTKVITADEGNRLNFILDDNLLQDARVSIVWSNV